MRVLLDQCTPVPLRHALRDHAVSTAYELGWATLKNGELLSAAELMGFQVFVTADANLRYQQNLALRKISIVVLSTTRWSRIEKSLNQIRAAINASGPGSYTVIDIDALLR